MERADPNVISVEDLLTALEDFRSEAAQNDPLSATPTATSVLTTHAPATPGVSARAQTPDTEPREAVSLADILTAEVSIESYEAVAIVQALCTLVLESRMPLANPTADLSGMRISANGAISAVSSGPHNRTAAIQCLGDVLSKTLPKKDFMFLRERVVEKTQSSPPYYSSVEELSDTLAYYERPDRAAQIREVYNRWQTRPSPTPPAPMHQRLLRTALDSAVAFSTRHARAGAVGLIGLAVVLVVGLLIFLAPGTGSNQTPRQPQNSSTVSNQNRPTMADAPASRITQPSAPVVSPASSRGPELVPTVPKKPRERPVSVAENRPSRPAPIETEGRRTITGSVATPLIHNLPSLPRPSPEERVEDAFVGGATQAVIYSASNADVIPPAVLFSQLPGPSPLASPQHDVPALEVVVNERGTVDMVRAVVRPRNIAESVVMTNGLSAAKAWRFRPALKDGHPVRYRLMVALGTD